MIVALAGGVGAARMLRGLLAVVDPASVTAIVNTGDDTVLHGLYISPDLDTVTYTLAGAINPETGWGRVGETWEAMAELRTLSDGRLSWFNLGDRDLGTHLYRTSRMAEGATLSQVTAEITARWGLALKVLPMTDDRVATRVTLAADSPDSPDSPNSPGGPPGPEIGFQEYFVGRQHSVAVSSVRFEGIDDATPAPGVLQALAGAERVVICPSNPVVSIGPVLATPGIAEVVAARRETVVAVSPIIAGRALKGPADRLLTELGHEASVVGVARLWAPYAATLVVDTADAELAGAVEAEGVRCVVAPTIMSDPAAAAALATTVLDAVQR
jgi:LPPG:FO 2-phospho-L-lactate transferase